MHRARLETEQLTTSALSSREITNLKVATEALAGHCLGEPCGLSLTVSWQFRPPGEGAGSSGTQTETLDYLTPIGSQQTRVRSFACDRGEALTFLHNNKQAELCTPCWTCLNASNHITLPILRTRHRVY